MKDNEYQCYICKGIFEKGQSDEEAVKELDSVFPLFTPDESELVCDDCYHDILKVKDTSSNNEKKEICPYCTNGFIGVGRKGNLLPCDVCGGMGKRSPL